MNTNPNEEFNNVRLKIDDFNEFSTEVMNKYFYNFSIDTKSLPNDYLNYHQILLYNFLDELELNSPKLKEKQILKILHNNFHNVIYMDLVKYLENGKTYKDFFQMLLDRKYLFQKNKMNIPFNIFLLDDTEFTENKVNIDALFLMQLCFFNKKYIFKYNSTPLNCFYLINEMGLINKMMEEHIPNVINKFIEQNFHKNEDLMHNFLNTINIYKTQFTPEQKRCFFKINSQISKELQNLSKENFVKRFSNCMRFMTKIDSKIISKDFFKEMLLKQIENLSSNHLSYILSIINNNHKGIEFDNLKTEILLHSQSKINFSNIIHQENNVFHSKKLIFEANNYNLIFPKAPQILVAIRNHPCFIKFDNIYNSKSHIQQCIIEFTTKEEIILSTEELIDLIRFEEPNLTKNNDIIFNFFNKLMNINNSYIREKNLYEKINLSNSEHLDINKASINKKKI